MRLRAPRVALLVLATVCRVIAARFPRKPAIVRTLPVRPRLHSVGGPRSPSGPSR